MHARAMRTNTPVSWHALRVGLKRFRYTVEILLPERSAEWDESLGQIQGLLGEIHDLDVLRARITQESDGIDARAAGSLRHTIGTKRRACLEQYRQRTRGEDSLLREWRVGLPLGMAITAATAARLRTTARAMDPDPRQTAIISRLALLLFDGLATSGAEPTPRHEQFAQLSPEHQERVRGLAGVLRLARGLRRCGVSLAAAALYVDATAAYVRVRVAGVRDTEENAARLAAAKHLLERYLQRPLLIELGKTTTSIYPLRLAHSSSRLRIPVGAGAGRVAQHIRPVAGKQRTG